MSAIVGIDLGTTFSAVARLDDAGRPVIVHNSDGQNITPSVVHFEEPGSPAIVGEDARKMWGRDNTRTQGRFKRDMGTDTMYRMVAGDMTPTDLSALVLQHLKSETEKAIGPIREAVVTVPANFANEAREATLAAAKIAGIDVKYIINEPTAAALYFAQQSGEDLRGIYAVFDLGGGTFDVTIVRVSGNDVEVLGSEGVSRLGGDDFDGKMFDLVAARYAEMTGGQLTKDDYPPSDREEDKKSLSRREKVIVNTVGDQGRININVTRAEYEEAISSYIAQMEMLCESALDEAKVSASRIDAVILAGGSTRTPAVQRCVSEVFGKNPVTFGNPDEVVALGAALYAAVRTDSANLNAIQRNKIESINLQERTHKYFGTLAIRFNEERQSKELENSIVIAKNTKIPCSVSKSYYTRADGQTQVTCRITEANAPESDPKFVKIIWEGDLTLPAGRPAGQEISVTFSYTDNQTMRCTFTDVATGTSKEIDLSMAQSEAVQEFDIEKFTVE
ncbi:MAG: Hsp70 family protein [Rhodospirillales bacterium]|nr:Hsp70 family protein [Rhodospirillales bacterium]